MKKTTESLTAQLKDVARAFCLEVWGHALDAARVSTKFEFRALDKVYYPSALQLAPNLPKLPANPSFVPPSTASSNHNPSSVLAKGKGKGEDTLLTTDVAIVENEKDVVEVVQSKKKKKDKDPEKKDPKEKQPVAWIFSPKNLVTFLQCVVPISNFNNDKNNPLNFFF